MLPMHLATQAGGDDPHPRLSSVGARMRHVTSLTPNAYATEPAQDTSKAQASDMPPPSPPHWTTWEFYLYYVAAALVIPYMIYVPMYLSSPSRPEYAKYYYYLVDGWMGGRMRDNSDHQYRLLRDHGLLLLVLMLSYAALSRLVRWIASRSGPHAQHVRMAFLGVTGAVFVTALHGINAVKLFVFSILNYVLASSAAWLPPHIVQAMIWAYNGGMLFLVFYTNGMPFATFWPSLAWLDTYAGLVPRWYISYNFTMLRLVSFALDYVWARCRRGTKPVPTGVPSKDRMHLPHELPAYSLTAQLLYLSYPPLFIAGPIVTFNDFWSQVCKPLHIPVRVIAVYACRCLFAVLSIEFMLHYMYVNAIKTAGVWDAYTPMEMAILSFWSLEFVWFKLVVPWRLFRLWALLDGVDVPENVIRSITNSPSALRFWRAWHRSYNLWVVRYIYIPLGGAKRQLVSSLVVFTFVALWHDLSFTLLAWAWLIVLFLVPEIVGRSLVPSRVYGQRPWFRHVRALSTVANMFMMISANLVGFVIGLDGVQFVWSQMVETGAGRVCLLQLIVVLFIAAQLMYEYRAEEWRRGIWKPY